MTSREYLYKVLKGPWGIKVSLTAEAMRTEGHDPDDVLVGRRIWISRRVAGRPLSGSETSMLVRGLGFLVDEISLAVSGEPHVIAVHDLRYVESDFQAEGLAAAMFGWAVAEFGLRTREIEVSFDRNANRYDFVWPDPGGV
jgi:hypothetical protein